MDEPGDKQVDRDTPVGPAADGDKGTTKKNAEHVRIQ